MLQNMKRSLYTALVLTVPVGVILIAIESKPAFAGCNPFGCSKSTVAECNPFGCPNPPSGAECTPFGCPDSPQPQPQPQVQNPPVVYPYPAPYPPPYPYPYPPQVQPNSSPKAVADCMENLLYRTEVQKPFPGWICVANDVNCRTVRVRTKVSDVAAAQACQNAR